MEASGLKAIKRGAGDFFCFLAPNFNTTINHAWDIAPLRVEMESLKVLLDQRARGGENAESGRPLWYGSSSTNAIFTSGTCNRH